MIHTIDRNQETELGAIISEMTPVDYWRAWAGTAALDDEGFRFVCETWPAYTAFTAWNAEGFSEWSARVPESVFIGVLEWWTGVDLSAFVGAPREVTLERISPVTEALERVMSPDIDARFIAGESWAEIRDDLLGEMKVEN